MSIKHRDKGKHSPPKRRKLSHDSHHDEAEAQSTSKSSSDSASRDDSGRAENLAETEEITSRPKASLQNIKRSTSAVLSNGAAPSKTSIMAMQVADLLDQIRKEFDLKRERLESTINMVIQTVKNTPLRNPVVLPQAEKASRTRKTASVPWILKPKSDINYTVAYGAPEDIIVRGEANRRLSMKGPAEIELAVTMPESLFQEKDYLNHRAFQKRAFYLSCIAEKCCLALGDEFETDYHFKDGNELIPVLIITKSRKAKLSTGLNSDVVMINPAFPNNVWPLEKTQPSRNCVRPHHQESPQTETLMPTPYYNSSLNSLSHVKEMDGIVENAGNQCEAFRDSCLLGQTWLQQRGFDSSEACGGFGLWEWAVICALLLISGGHRGQPLFSNRYTSIQLFKAMLQVLAGKDLTENFIVRSNVQGIPRTDLPVFLDGATGINLLYRMTCWSYAALRQNAQLSLDAVNARTEDSFHSTFIRRSSDRLLCYDEIYSMVIDLPKQDDTLTARKVLDKLCSVLKRGLGDRISALDIKSEDLKSWPVRTVNKQKSQLVVEVALKTDAQHAARVIDHGPSAEEKVAAQDFRLFWGEKSELRRFRDGSINESLTWSTAEPVIPQIIRYLAVQHLQATPSSIMLKSHRLEIAHFPESKMLSAADAFKLINNKYQTLSSTLHQLDGLPLPIRSVAPAGLQLRSASMSHPLEPATAFPIEMLVQFDSSARWPDSMPAIQHTKIAFLNTLDALLSEKDTTVSTRLGVENTESSSTGYFNTSFLDIVYPSPGPGLAPLVFRLRIHHEREVHLLQKFLADKSLHGSTYDTVATALAMHKKAFVAAPSHTTSIRTLISQFLPLSDTIRLLKKWVSAHHMSNHIPAEVLEILAAHIFLHPAPWSVPGCATTAFLRCLDFLSRWDWTNDPLTVDFSASQDLSSEAAKELQTRFQAWRKLDPNMNTVAWFIGTNVDNTGVVWTQGPQPARVVAGRITALARASIELVKTKDTAMIDSDWESLFTSALVDFDFSIQIKPSVIKGSRSNRTKGSGSKFKNLQVQDEIDIDTIGYDAVQLYLADLEKAFGGAALFFYGGDGQHVIAGLWRPTTQGEKEWRVRLGYSTVPMLSTTDKEDKPKEVVSKVNTQGMLVEMAVLGEGLVNEITVKG